MCLALVYQNTATEDVYCIEFKPNDIRPDPERAAHRESSARTSVQEIHALSIVNVFYLRILCL